MNKAAEDDRQLSRREWARKMRREAYQRAKERRASYPTYLLAIKEEAKRRRREASRVMKERKKAAAAKMKRTRKSRSQPRSEHGRPPRSG